MGKILDRYNDLLNSYMTEGNAAKLIESASEKMDVISGYVTARAKLGLMIQFHKIDSDTFLRESGVLINSVRESVIWRDKECLRMALPLFYGLDYNNPDALRDFSAMVFNELIDRAQSLLSDSE